MTLTKENTLFLGKNKVKSQLRITLSPIFKSQAPHIIISLNNDTRFSNYLNEKKKFTFDIDESASIDLHIQRSGRTKEIMYNDVDNGFTIQDLQINRIKVNPNLGKYTCQLNDFVDDHIIRGDTFTLNGKYSLHIPFYPMNGEITIGKKKLSISKQYHKYAFFGASMTDWDFTRGRPQIKGQLNYADNFIGKLGGINLASSSQTNQQVFTTVYEYIKNKNRSKIIFAQLISHTARQVRIKEKNLIYRWSAHQNKDLDCIDDFTKKTLRSLQESFVCLDIDPIIALQISEYKKLIDYCTKNGSKIFFISYFRDEFNALQQAIPNNLAPYFNLDPNTAYCRNNGYHATPDEHNKYFENLVDFVGKIT